MCKKFVSKQTDRKQPPATCSYTDNKLSFNCKASCCKLGSFYARAFPKERSKSRVSRLLWQREKIKICEKCFFCHSIVLCKSCNKCQTCCLKSVGARLQNFWQIWLDLGAGPKVVQILKEGYTLPFQIRPKLTRYPTVVSCYVNPHRNSYLLEALHQLIDKNAVELVQNQKSLGFFNRLFLVPKPNNKWRPILDLSKLNLFLKTEKFKMETPETIRTSLQQGEWVISIDFKDGCLLSHPNTGTIQEISEISFPGSDIPIQSTALWSVHSTLGVHSNSKGGETDGHIQGYKNPPVPRRLVGESHIPPGLSPTYSRSGEDMQRTRVDGEFGKIRTGAQTNI